MTSFLVVCGRDSQNRQFGISINCFRLPTLSHSTGLRDIIRFTTERVVVKNILDSYNIYIYIYILTVSTCAPPVQAWEKRVQDRERDFYIKWWYVKFPQGERGGGGWVTQLVVALLFPSLLLVFASLGSFNYSKIFFSSFIVTHHSRLLTTRGCAEISKAI